MRIPSQLHTLPKLTDFYNLSVVFGVYEDAESIFNTNNVIVKL